MKNLRAVRKIIDQARFDELTPEESDIFKQCLSSYIPVYVDYKFSLANDLGENDIVIKMPLETIQPPKAHILEKADYTLPLTFKIKLEQNLVNKDEVFFIFEITLSKHQDKFRRTDKVYSGQEIKHESQALRIKYNQFTKNYSIATLTNNQFNDPNSQFSANESEALSLLYFYSMNIMRGIAGNITECYFPKQMTENIVLKIESMRNDLDTNNVISPYVTE